MPACIRTIIISFVIFVMDSVFNCIHVCSTVIFGFVTESIQVCGVFKKYTGKKGFIELCHCS